MSRLPPPRPLPRRHLVGRQRHSTRPPSPLLASRVMPRLLLPLPLPLPLLLPLLREPPPVLPLAWSRRLLLPPRLPLPLPLPLPLLLLLLLLPPVLPLAWSPRLLLPRRLLLPPRLLLLPGTFLAAGRRAGRASRWMPTWRNPLQAASATLAPGVALATAPAIARPPPPALESVRAPQQQLLLVKANGQHLAPRQQRGQHRRQVRNHRSFCRAAVSSPGLRHRPRRWQQRNVATARRVLQRSRGTSGLWAARRGMPTAPPSSGTT